MIIPQIKFVFDRQHRASDMKKGSIDLRITFGSRQKFVATGVRCYPGEWDAKKECVRSISSVEDNAIILKIRKKALTIIADMVGADRIDLDAIPSMLKQQSIDTTFEEYIKVRMRMKQVSDYTKAAYVTFYNRFVTWGKMRFFQDINERNIRAWDEYLHSVRWKEKDRFGKEVERKYSQATIGSMHKNLKAFINDAVVDDIIKSNPYSVKRIRIDKGSTRIESFLTKEEVEAIEKADMPTLALTETRDLFLLQCYTGLSYIDLMAYDFTKIKGMELFSVLTGIRHKTGVPYVFVLTEKAQSILERYNYVIPKLPNQKYNVRLKLVADAAGIDKSICSHDGRRSCGSMLLNAGVPIGVVSRILGHSSIKQTESAYARLLDSTIAEEIKKRMK